MLAGSRFECWASRRAPGTNSRSARSLSPPATAARSGFMIINKAPLKIMKLEFPRVPGPFSFPVFSIPLLRARQPRLCARAASEPAELSSTAARLHGFLPVKRSRMPKAVPKVTTCPRSDHEAQSRTARSGSGAQPTLGVRGAEQLAGSGRRAHAPDGPHNRDRRATMGHARHACVMLVGQSARAMALLALCGWRCPLAALRECDQMPVRHRRRHLQDA